MRSSRETELVERFPVHVVTAWLGNTPEIARRHYLQVTDEHFWLASTGEALQPALQQPAVAPRKASNDRGSFYSGGVENENAPQEPKTGSYGELRELAVSCAAVVSPCYETTSGEGGIRTRGPGLPRTSV